MNPATIPVTAANQTLSERDFQPVWDAFQRKDLAKAKFLFEQLKHKRIPVKTALYFTAGYVKLKLGIQ